MPFHLTNVVAKPQNDQWQVDFPPSFHLPPYLRCRETLASLCFSLHSCRRETSSPFSSGEGRSYLSTTLMLSRTHLCQLCQVSFHHTHVVAKLHSHCSNKCLPCLSTFHLTYTVAKHPALSAATSSYYYTPFYISTLPMSSRNTLSATVG